MNDTVSAGKLADAPVQGLQLIFGECVGVENLLPVLI